MLPYGLQKMDIPCMFSQLTSILPSHKCFGLRISSSLSLVLKIKRLRSGLSLKYGMMKRKSRQKWGFFQRNLKLKLLLRKSKKWFKNNLK